jgi:hypothetical protein
VKVDFGAGRPRYVKTDILPWSDWWYAATAGKLLKMHTQSSTMASALTPAVIQVIAAVGIDDEEGIIVRLVLEHGTARKLEKHVLWTVLAGGSQLALAGADSQPFGTLPTGLAQ